MTWPGTLYSSSTPSSASHTQSTSPSTAACLGIAIYQSHFLCNDQVKYGNLSITLSLACLGFTIYQSYIYCGMSRYCNPSITLSLSCPGFAIYQSNFLLWHARVLQFINHIISGISRFCNLSITLFTVAWPGIAIYESH
jgi:hypothetical protein